MKINNIVVAALSFFVLTGFDNTKMEAIVDNGVMPGFKTISITKRQTKL